MTREEAIKVLNMVEAHGSLVIQAKKMAIKALEQTRWIPVSERLPEETDECLCCDEDGYMTIGFVSKYRKAWCFVDDDETDINVIAWMPLPEPYKPEKEVKDHEI